MPLNSPSGVYKITGILKDPGTEAIKATVKEKMELFGSVNKA